MTIHERPFGRYLEDFVPVQHLRDTFQVLFTHMPEMGSE
jgi:hypothetical protein